MIKPERLRPGDTVAIVSLSSGILGEPWAIHKLEIARERLEQDFSLSVKVMPNALKGVDWLDAHPEARAADLMEAFADPAVKGIITAIGGDDSIRLLPYIDFDLMHRNPKIFTGFSDTTISHFMLYKAGLVSYYGPCIMCNFGEYVRINDYTLSAIRNCFFEPQATLDIPSAPYWHDDEDEKILWCPENRNTAIPYHPEEVGYELIQGGGVVEGELLGGCIDVFPMINGTSLWPSLDQWRGKLLFLETSEEDMPCDYLTWYLRNLAAQRILDVISGVLVGKPARRSKYEPYKEVYRRVLGREVGRPELPVLFNVNIGHAEPIGILPYGLRCRLDGDHRRLTLLEPAVN